MKATVLDLRHRMKEVLKALERNEPVTIYYRGRKKGVLYPVDDAARSPVRVADHPAFGMWRDREEVKDVGKAVRALRRDRFDDV